MNQPKQKEILILLLCLLIGFALRFYTLDRKSLWLDEIYTFNDSRDNLQGQLKYYKENPTYLHPPLFFILTHLFYPFTKPERDLRIIPLIFGSLSIPMFYFLSRSFSPNIALPCTLSLTFMAYHISLSQDGRSYSLLMFLGMAGLYFFLKHLETSKKRYLILVALFFASLFYTSYSSIPFIALSQILWFYRVSEDHKKPTLSSLFILNGLIFLLCISWVLFVALNFKGQPMMDPYQARVPISFVGTIYGILHDWVPHLPLIITSVILLILFPFFSKHKKNAIVLLTTFVLPIGGLYLFCKLLNVNHFITSRYFINFLPIFLIALYLSLGAIQDKFERLKGVMRLSVLFVILFMASNLVILPFYYSSEKQDFRGLVNYLKAQLRDGDKIFDFEMGYVPGILHYFGIYPEGRQYLIPFSRISEKEIELRKSFIYKNKKYTIYCSKTCCHQYIADGSRLWIVTGRDTAKVIKKNLPCVVKGYFDGSFLNFNRFPTDASMYLFLLNPVSPNEKGIDIPIE
jgi:hypothetical protein